MALSGSSLFAQSSSNFIVFARMTPDEGIKILKRMHFLDSPPIFLVRESRQYGMLTVDFHPPRDGQCHMRLQYQAKTNPDGKTTYGWNTIVGEQEILAGLERYTDGTAVTMTADNINSPDAVSSLFRFLEDDGFILSNLIHPKGYEAAKDYLAYVDDSDDSEPSPPTSEDSVATEARVPR